MDLSLDQTRQTGGTTAAWKCHVIEEVALDILRAGYNTGKAPFTSHFQTPTVESVEIC